MADGLRILSILSLTVAGACGLWIAIDILQGHRQHIAVVNVVWPITALHAGPLALWAYYRSGECVAAEAGDQGENVKGKM